MKIAVIIPTYRAVDTILQVIAGIPNYIDAIFVVDDKCPDKSGSFVKQQCKDPRVVVLFNSENMGVGGAVINGYKAALEEEFDIMLKIDSDGQMDTSQMHKFLLPVINGEADYTKGNRFIHLDALKEMPRLRLIGNSSLSLINKFVNGYWNIMDPTNGYTAIHRSALELIDLGKVDKRYFFESDMLFRLGINKAVVKDVALPAIYAGEVSSLSISRVIVEFPLKYAKRFLKRIAYLYFIHDFNAGTIQLFTGIPFFLFGLVFGLLKWYESITQNQIASSGTVMLAALPLIIGFQLILGWLYYDIQQVPQNPVSKYYKKKNDRFKLNQEDNPQKN